MTSIITTSRILPGEITCTSTIPYPHSLLSLSKFITLKKTIIPLTVSNGKTNVYAVGDKILIKIDVKSTQYLLKNIVLKDIIPEYLEFKGELKITSKSDKKIMIITKKNPLAGDLRLITKIDKLIPGELIVLKYLVIPKSPGQHLIPSTTCYIGKELVGTSNTLIIQVVPSARMQRHMIGSKRKELRLDLEHSLIKSYAN